MTGIGELLLDVAKDPWVILVGEAGWVKLDRVGAIFRNTRPGTPFEARRHGSAEDSEYEIFHICRPNDCGFAAASRNLPEYLGKDGRPRATNHVARFAFKEKTAPVVPAVDLPGPAEIVHVFKTPKKLIDGLILTGLLFLVRLKQVLASVDVSQAVSDATTLALHGVIGSCVYGVCAFETGLVGGVTKFYWDDRTSGALWLNRLLVYGGLIWFSDVHLRVYQYARARSGKPLASGPRGRSGISDNGPDADDTVCSASSLYMAFPGKLTALCQKPCKETLRDLAPYYLRITRHQS